MIAKQRMTRYQDLMAKHCNAKVKPQHFNIGDLVFRKVTTATKVFTHGKLGPNWECLYRIIDCNRKGTYHLETLDGQRLHHPWNIELLKKYYSSALATPMLQPMLLLLLSLFFRFLFK